VDRMGRCRHIGARFGHRRPAPGWGGSGGTVARPYIRVRGLLPPRALLATPRRGEGMALPAFRSLNLGVLRIPDVLRDDGNARQPSSSQVVTGTLWWSG